MKNIVLLSVFISFLNCGFSQDSENDTIYFKFDKITQTYVSNELYWAEPWNNYIQNFTRYLTLYNTKDSSLFTGVIIYKKLNIPSYGQEFRTNYSLSISDYKNGIPLPYTTRNYTYYQNGLFKRDTNSISHSPFSVVSFYVADKRYTNNDTVSIWGQFDRNGDTLYCDYTKQIFNQDGIYQHSLDVIYEKHISKSYHSNNKLSHYVFRESFLTYLPDERKIKNHHSYNYSLSQKGDTTTYYTYVDGKKTGYSLMLNPLRNNDTIRYKVRTIMQNDSLHDVLDTNLIYVDTKFNLLTEKEFIAIKNDKMPYGFALFSQHTLLKVEINGITYYIVFPEGSKYGWTDDYYNIVSQKAIDKIIKKYKKYLLKN